MTDPGLCPAVLALELAVPVAAHARVLPTEAAALLVDHVAADLVRILPGVHELGLAFAAGLMDPAQVLRPQWPAYAALARLYRAEPRTQRAPQLIGYGAAGGHMADAALEPDTALGAGPLLLMPWLLVGEAGVARAAALQLDEVLHDQGLAGAGVALVLQQALGLELRHARYFTHHDLCALTAIHLEHAGLAAAWTLLETALLAPGQRADATTASGQPWRYSHGAVDAGVAGYAQWHAHFGTGEPPARCAAAFAAWQLEQRRTSALLRAHALAPRHVALAGGSLPDAAPSLPDAVLLEPLVARRGNGSVTIVAHTWDELGVVALSAVEDVDGTRVALERAYPLGDSLEPALHALAAHHALAARIDVRTPLAADPADPSRLRV